MSSRSEKPTWQVLDFLCDDDGSCALTVFVDGTRFHIIADAGKLNQDTEVGTEYRELLQQYQNPREDGPKYHYRTKTSNSGSDSGVDVTEEDREGQKGETNTADDDPETSLQSWMVDPLSDNFDLLTQESISADSLTIQEWYHCPTRFCELIPSEDGAEIEAIELDDSVEMQKRVQKLIPSAALPKYISDKLDVKCYHASNFHVLEASNQPPGTPYHPSKVKNRKTNEAHFLKVVDNGQPGPVKRELDILNRVKQLQLHHGINVPLLEGIVSFDDLDETPTGKRKIMGFLQTDIPNPTPLTMKLTTDVPQEKRDEWAKEAERVKEILHDHEIVWGDAKADNFMVDENDKMWIIDFGGSYTEGWVDKELNETEEGDDVGTEKVVNALHDPVANTQDTEDNVENKLDQSTQSVATRKRNRAEVDESGDDDGSRFNKASRNEHT